MKVKMKTRSGAAKRFKKTANGFKRKQAFKSHILTKKSPKRIRQLRGLSWCTSLTKQQFVVCAHTSNSLSSSIFD